ncbi:hypothetical protein V6N13_132887 [Hibiscus sabdariffa]|uniref:BZIP domain-containing protein n=1 Tax=Hibiscus sabdariffa TaxID=183260 RepID=A0ABR2PX78_9ROSI
MLLFTLFSCSSLFVDLSCWQEIAPIPSMFTDQNATLQPRSPLYFSDYHNGPIGLDEIFRTKTQGHADDSVQPNNLRNHPPLDCGAGSRQERVLSPEIPPPCSSLLLSGPVSLEEMCQQTQGHADGSVQPNDVLDISVYPLACSDNSIPATPSQGLPQQGDQLPMQSYGWPDKQNLMPSSNRNQLQDILSSLQNPSLRSNQQQNHQANEKPLSKDKKYRLRVKAKQQAKDDYFEMLEHQSSIKDEHIACLLWEINILKNNKDEEIALLRSEIEVLRNNKNEEIALLKSIIEMLREENASINHNNLPIH